MRPALLSVVLLLVGFTPLQAQFPEEIKGSIAFVSKLQVRSGGFLATPPVPGTKPATPTLRDTSAAVRALKYLDGEVPDREACQKFVASCFTSSGGFANTPGGQPDVFLTAVGLMAVVELKMPVEKYAAGVVKYLSENAKSFEDIRIAVAGLERLEQKAPKTEAWLAEVRKLANPDGTYGKEKNQARATGSAVVTLLRLGVRPENRERILAVLNEGQLLSGGFGKENAEVADLETSYRVMRCYHMLKAQPEGAEALRTFVAKCRNSDGGYGISPGATSTVGATYFAIIIQRWLRT